MKTKSLLTIIIVVFFLASCQTMFSTGNPTITVNIVHDGKTDTQKVNSGSTIRQVVSSAGLSLGALDEITPSLDEIASDGSTIKIVRITEDYQVEDTTLPFESQTVKNESLSVGQTLLIQAGMNGIQSNTYRIVTADGVERSRTIVKSEITQSAQPEIIMVGIQSPYKSVSIQGELAYISSSNAWVMEGTTGNRREVANSGNLDGRIFTLSDDGKWLLYSVSGDNNPNEINSLWVVNLADSNSSPVALDVKNVVNYAQWVPGKQFTIAYSTVEPRSAAPGWQANNDLVELNFNETGKTLQKKVIIDTNPGGVYGWWGTIYDWSPDGSEIAFARPDSVGLVLSDSGELDQKIEFTPYQTQGDWAWVPGIAWINGHSALYMVLPVASDSGDSSSFDLSAFILGNGAQIDLQSNTGMFSYPAVSNSADRLTIAFLSAILPNQSSTSSYELRIMDRDGSNMNKLYPGEGIQGLDPQHVVWSPAVQSDEEIAFIAQGNIMFVNPSTGNLQQITGDESVSKIDWK